MSTGKFTGLFRMIWVLCILLCSCSSAPSRNAPDRNFYFEIVKHRNDNYSAQLSDDLKRHISKHKYTITNQSGTRWPFYKELNPDEDLPKDSLMPPHWFLHRMVVMKPDQRLEIDDYFVRIGGGIW